MPGPSIIKFLFPFILTLMVVPTTWGLVAQDQPDKTMLVDGRRVHYDERLTIAIRKNLFADLSALIDLRSPDLQGIDLEELRDRSQKVKLVVAEGEPFIGSGYRNGAVNFAEQGMVLYNRHKFNGYTLTQKALVQLHEALGAMGYDDDNYLISIIISHFLRSKTSLHPRILERFKQQLQAPRNTRTKVWAEVAGGASGVGGGGDGDIAEIKWMLLAYVNFLAKNNEMATPREFPTLIDLAIDTPVESVEFKSKYTGLVFYKQVTIGINRFTNKITLLVDSQTWDPVDRTRGLHTESNKDLLYHMFVVLKALNQPVRTR